jgi:hypothetical protein
VSAFGVSPRTIGVPTGSPFERTLARDTPPGLEMVGAHAPPRSARLRNHLMGWDLTDADHVGEPMRIHARSDAPLAHVHKAESVIVDRSAPVPAAFVAGTLDTRPKPCSGKPELDLLVLGLLGG